MNNNTIYVVNLNNLIFAGDYKVENNLDCFLSLEKEYMMIYLYIEKLRKKINKQYQSVSDVKSWYASRKTERFKRSDFTVEKSWPTFTDNFDRTRSGVG